MAQTLCHQTYLKIFPQQQVTNFKEILCRSRERRTNLINAFLVNTGKSLVLVDSGAASCFGAHLGSVLTNLKASGYQPEQVDTILLTHLHPDHVCGISKDGVANFPNATVYVSNDEANYWLDPNKQRNFQKTSKPTIKEQWKKLNKPLHHIKPNNALKRINSVMTFRL
jgi:glyoxylase-like metal-dependent hydrolase (beta-lactamase superfamily II)